AACRLGGRRLDELFDKYGRDTLLAAIEQIFDETERKCRNVVLQLPDGVYEASASIDDDGVLKGEEVPIHVKVTVKRGDMTIDLSGCSAERKADQLADLCRCARRLQGADRPARSSERGVVPR